MMSMNSPGLVGSDLFESVPSLEFSERLEQGVVEGVGVLDLWNMTEPRQQRQAGLWRQQRAQIERLLDRGHAVLVAPQDCDGHVHSRIGIAVGAGGVAVGAEEIVKPIGDIGGAVAQRDRPL